MVDGAIDYPQGFEPGPWDGHAARSVFEGKFSYETWYCIPGLGCAEILDYDTARVKSVETYVDERLHVTAHYDALHDGLGISAQGVDMSFYGNRFANEVSGDRGDDRIAGRRGDDTLRGLGGDDRLAGGKGDDWLSGGSGKDMLIGGPGADTFHFRRAGDCGLGRARDVVDDFQAGRDVLALRAIDADLTESGNQRFDFIGAGRFSGEAGELRLRGAVLAGDTDGDRHADFQIEFAAGAVPQEADILL